MSHRAWKATRQNALGQWKSSLFQMVWSYLLFPSPNCLLWSKTKTQSLTFSQHLSDFKGYWKDAVISLYACGSQEHGRMSKCQIVLRSSWSKIEPLTRKYFVAFSFRKREVLFFEELSFNSLLFNWRKVFCYSWDFSWILDHFNNEGPGTGCSLHPQNLELTWKWCFLYLSLSRCCIFKLAPSSWPVLNLSSIQVHHAVRPMNYNLLRLKPGMKH